MNANEKLTALCSHDAKLAEIVRHVREHNESAYAETGGILRPALVAIETDLLSVFETREAIEPLHVWSLLRALPKGEWRMFGATIDDTVFDNGFMAHGCPNADGSLPQVLRAKNKHARIAETVHPRVFVLINTLDPEARIEHWLVNIAD